MSCLFNNGNNSSTVVVSGGTGSVTFIDTDSRRLVHLYILRTNSTTTYSWKITEKNSLDVAGEKSIKRDVKIKNSKELPEYLYGNFTLTIYNSDNDEDFTVLPVFSEQT